MTMVSITLILLFLAVGLLGLMLVAGLILLLVGMVNRNKHQHINRHSAVTCIKLGAILVVLPLLTVVVLSVAGVSMLVTTAIKRTTYECVPDRWRNEWVTEHQAADEVINALLTSADSGDREAFAKNFTPIIQANDDFDTVLDAFFTVYPTGLSQCHLDSDGSTGSASYDYGHVVKESSISYECILNDEWYYLTLNYCYRNTDKPEQVGVYAFTVMNLPARAVYEEHLSRNNHHDENTYLLCDRQNSREVNARLIGGTPLLWTPSDTPKHTADEWCTLLSSYHQLSDSIVKDIFGAPNAAIHYSNSNLYEYYYELTPENNQPRYVYVPVTSPNDKILGVYLCTSDEILFEKPIWLSDEVE